MQYFCVRETMAHVKLPLRQAGELSLVVVLHENAVQAQRDLHGMLDAVRRLLEADLGRV